MTAMSATGDRLALQGGDIIGDLLGVEGECVQGRNIGYRGLPDGWSRIADTHGPWFPRTISPPGLLRQQPAEPPSAHL